MSSKEFNAPDIQQGLNTNLLNKLYNEFGMRKVHLLLIIRRFHKQKQCFHMYLIGHIII